VERGICAKRVDAGSALERVLCYLRSVRE